MARPLRLGDGVEHGACGGLDPDEDRVADDAMADVEDMHAWNPADRRDVGEGEAVAGVDDQAGGLGSFGGGKFTLGALVSLIVTVADIGMFNIGAAFWGLVAGFGVSWLMEKHDFTALANRT